MKHCAVQNQGELMVPVAKIKEAISRGANKEEENAKTPIGRSLKHLIEVVTDLEKWGLGFKSLTENIDTTTSGGKLIFHTWFSLALGVVSTHRNLQHRTHEHNEITHGCA